MSENGKVEIKQIDYLWNIFSANQSWIRLSDTKAGAILASNAGIMTVALANSSKIEFLLAKDILFKVLFLGGLSTVILSTLFMLWSLSPIFRVGEPNSIIYYEHIAKKTKSASVYAQNINDAFANNAQFGQLAEQVWATSIVASKKLHKIKCGIVFFITTIIIIIFTILLAIVA